MEVDLGVLSPVPKQALKCNCFHISLSESELYLNNMSQTLAITHQVVNFSSTGFMDHSIWVAALDIDPCCHSHLWLGPGDHLLACCPWRHHGVGSGYSCDHSGFAHIAGYCLQGWWGAEVVSCQVFTFTLDWSVNCLFFFLSDVLLPNSSRCSNSSSHNPCSSYNTGHPTVTKMEGLEGCCVWNHIHIKTMYRQAVWDCE